MLSEAKSRERSDRDAATQMMNKANEVLTKICKQKSRQVTVNNMATIYCGPALRKYISCPFCARPEGAKYNSPGK